MMNQWFPHMIVVVCYCTKNVLSYLSSDKKKKFHIKYFSKFENALTPLLQTKNAFFFYPSSFSGEQNRADRKNCRGKQSFRFNTKTKNWKPKPVLGGKPENLI